MEGETLGDDEPGDVGVDDQWAMVGVGEADAVDEGMLVKEREGVHGGAGKDNLVVVAGEYPIGQFVAWLVEAGVFFDVGYGFGF